MTDIDHAAQRPITGVTPHLTIPSRGAEAAIEFYGQAFAAVVIHKQVAEDGERLMHAHLKINGGSIMLHDEFPEYGMSKNIKPVGITLHIQVEDPDAWWANALGAGAEPIMDMADQFWVDRYGQVKDPFDYIWSIGGTIKSTV